MANVTPLVPDVAGGTVSATSITGYLSEIFPLLIKLGIMVAIISIAYYGLRKIISNVPGVESESKQRMNDALWGLAILLAAYLILNTINPKIIETIQTGITNLGS